MVRRRIIMILLFLLIFCVLGFLMIKWVQHPTLGQLTYKDYLSLVTSFASLFVALVFILEYCHIQKSEKVLQQLPFADNNQDYWAQMEAKFSDDPDLYPLYTELHTNHPELQPALESKNFTKIKEVQTISLLLSQIENMLIFHGGIDLLHDTPRKEQQIRVWKRYFKSPTLRYHYQYLKENLGLDTKAFIEKYLL